MGRTRRIEIVEKMTRAVVVVTEHDVDIEQVLKSVFLSFHFFVSVYSLRANTFSTRKY